MHASEVPAQPAGKDREVGMPSDLSLKVKAPPAPLSHTFAEKPTLTGLKLSATEVKVSPLVP